MSKRKALFKVLRKKIAKFFNSEAFLITLLVLFLIIGGIIGFKVSKSEPIPLTEEEIEYYISQAEIGYFQGISYLDEGIKLDMNNDDTINIYSCDEPDEKQKLEITFYNNEIIKSEPYYSITFDIAYRLVYAIYGVCCGFFSWLVLILLLIFIEWLLEKITSFKKEVQEEVEKNEYSAVLEEDIEE